MRLTDTWAFFNLHFECTVCRKTFSPTEWKLPTDCPNCGSRIWAQWFRERHVVIAVEGCWVWTGTVNGMYGTKRGKMAHRLMYEKYKGQIPQGYVIDHRCFVQLCVNPDHLEAVTRAENTSRGSYSRYRKSPYWDRPKEGSNAAD